MTAADLAERGDSATAFSRCSTFGESRRRRLDEVKKHIDALCRRRA
jgi:hypothetical protein